LEEHRGSSVDTPQDRKVDPAADCSLFNETRVVVATEHHTNDSAGRDLLKSAHSLRYRLRTIVAISGLE
jgi:hypothetical protein